MEQDIWVNLDLGDFDGESPLMSGLLGSIIEGIKQQFVEQLRQTQCPTHGTNARIILATGPIDKRLRFKIGGCCENLLKTVRAGFDESCV